MKLVLTSFKICPFAQMAMILSDKNKLDIEIKFINIQQPPEWFSKLSPTGAVPMLEADNRVIFESIVILELLNEMSANNLHPNNVLDKAVGRAWMSFATSLFSDLFVLTNTKDEDKFKTAQTTLVNKLDKIAKQHSGAEFFLGTKFSLVDIAFAPFFMRIDWINQWTNNALNIVPKSLNHWQKSILAKTYVSGSVGNEVEDIYLSMVEQFDGVLAGLIVDE